MSTAPKRPTEAWISAQLFESGLGQVVVARFKSSGEVEAGVFLVDTYCRGVKDAYFVRLWHTEYQQRLLESMEEHGGCQAIEPACARKLIEGAVAYARNAGFSPHPDYKRGARVFGGIDPAGCNTEFEYGKDGKPLFISSPGESMDFVHRALGILRARFGEDGFHYMVGIGEVRGGVGSDDDVEEPTDDASDSGDAERR